MTLVIYLLSVILSTTLRLFDNFSANYLLRFVAVMMIVSISLLAILTATDSSRIFGKRLVCQMIQSLPRFLRPFQNLLASLVLLILILALLNLIFISIVFSMFFIFG